MLNNHQIDLLKALQLANWQQREDAIQGCKKELSKEGLMEGDHLNNEAKSFTTNIKNTLKAKFLVKENENN